MARSNGFNRYSGKLGDLIHFRRGKKQFVKSKPTKPYNLSENTIKSGRDFGEASRNGSYIRKALDPLVKAYSTDDLHNRLNKLLTTIFKGIPSGFLGQKKLGYGNLLLLQQFEFNNSARFEKLWDHPVELHIDPEYGFKLTLPKGTVTRFVKDVPRATAAVLQVMIFQYDLDEGDHYEVIRMNDLFIPLLRPAFPKTMVNIPLNHQGDKAFIVAAGIQFLAGNDRIWNKRYFACKITHALHLINGQQVYYVDPPKSIQEDPEDETGWDWETEEE